MRLFTGIEVAAEVRQELAKLLARLTPLADLKWSLVEKLHITTKFIGEWPEDRLEEMKRVFAAAGSPGPVRIEVRGLGWFPNARHPRVLWAGVDGGPPLRSLAQSTEHAVAKLGIPDEDRPYSPHLTLARIKDRVPLDNLRSAVGPLESQSFGDYNVTAFYLYLSAGGKYTKLAEFPLIG